MSIEVPDVEVRAEDETAALELIAEHPLLKNDKYARDTVEAGGKVNGTFVDLGDFLVARAAHLEMMNAENKITAVRGRNPSAYNAAVAVVHSTRPELEEK